MKEYLILFLSIACLSVLPLSAENIAETHIPAAESEELDLSTYKKGTVYHYLHNVDFYLEGGRNWITLRVSHVSWADNESPAEGRIQKLYLHTYRDGRDGGDAMLILSRQDAQPIIDKFGMEPVVQNGKKKTKVFAAYFVAPWENKTIRLERNLEEAGVFGF